MIKINVTPTDITQMRFAFSPLLEAVASFHMLNKRKPYPVQYYRWVEEAKRALHGVDLPYMKEFVTNCSYIPDFLTPTPTVPSLDFDDDLDRLCQTPTPLIESHIRVLISIDNESALLHHALAHPREALNALISELRIYWDRTLSHHWSRMVAILENDVLYRAREQALYGSVEMLNGLHPQIAYEDSILYIKKEWKWDDKLQCPLWGFHHDISGRGLQIVPVIFSDPHVSWQMGEDFLPMFIYGARGQGLWHCEELDDPEEALQITLGVGRSRVLYALTTPRSTSELAYYLDITSGAVSQHLNRLSQAGLVESSRSGKRVFYRLSQRGRSLIELFM